MAVPRQQRIASIVVAYNGGDSLIDCVQALAAQSVATQIIVVDNGSRDGSIEGMISRVESAVQVIRLASNRGYAAGANAGRQATDADLIAVFNQDVVADRDCLLRMRDALLGWPITAMVSPKLVLWRSPDLVNAIGNAVHWSGVSWCLGLETAAETWTGVVEVPAISGAAFMLSTDLFDELGGLEEGYFMYLEDVDFSVRGRLHGAACIVACEATAAHDWEFVISPQKFALLERNRRAFWGRIWGGRRRWLPLLIQAEMMSWTYSFLRGAPFVRAKLGAMRKPLSLPPLHASDFTRLRPWLAHRHPYSQLLPRSRLAEQIGWLVDRMVLFLSGIETM